MDLFGRSSVIYLTLARSCRSSTVVRERTNSNLVDPASSHTLVSKIKPCMCKYKRLYTVKLRTAHYISYSLFDTYLTTWITVVILELIHARNPDFSEGMYLLDINQPASAVFGES